MSTGSDDWTGRAEERIEKIEENARETLDEASAIRDEIEGATDYPQDEPAYGTPHPDHGGQERIDLSGGGGGASSGGTTDD